MGYWSKPQPEYFVHFVQLCWPSFLFFFIRMGTTVIGQFLIESYKCVAKRVKDAIVFGKFDLDTSKGLQMNLFWSLLRWSAFFFQQSTILCHKGPRFCLSTIPKTYRLYVQVLKNLSNKKKRFIGIDRPIDWGSDFPFITLTSSCLASVHELKIAMSVFHWNLSAMKHKMMPVISLKWIFCSTWNEGTNPAI